MLGGSDEPNEPQDLPLSFYRSDNGTRNSEFSDEDVPQLDNQYFQMISTLTPGEMVGQFVKTASPRVQVKIVELKHRLFCYGLNVYNHADSCF
jgi:hypothetical protein